MKRIRHVRLPRQSAVSSKEHTEKGVISSHTRTATWRPYDTIMRVNTHGVTRLCFARNKSNFRTLKLWLAFRDNSLKSSSAGFAERVGFPRRITPMADAQARESSQAVLVRPTAIARRETWHPV